MAPSNSGWYKIFVPLSGRIYTDIIETQALENEYFVYNLAPSGCFFSRFGAVQISERNPDLHFVKDSVTLNLQDRNWVNISTYTIMAVGFLIITYTIYITPDFQLNKEKIE